MSDDRADITLPLFAGKHASHRMHPHSVAANATVPHGPREEAVCGVLREAGVPMTDRQICTALGSADMNFARPSITHLVDRGALVEVDSVECPTTGRTVRRVWFVDS